MLDHNIANSDVNRKFKQVLKDQQQNQYKNTFYQKVKKNCKNPQIDISDVTFCSKLKWKRKEKRKAIDKLIKMIKVDDQEKSNVAQYSITNMKGNNKAKSVKVIE